MNNEYDENSNMESSSYSEDNYSDSSQMTESDNQPDEIQDNNATEDYYPEEINPNTSFGQYKLRQAQLQREAEAIKQRQMERAERNNQNKTEEESKDSTSEESETKENSEQKGSEEKAKDGEEKKTDKKEESKDSTSEESETKDNSEQKGSEEKAKDGEEKKTDKTEDNKNGLRSKIDKVGGKIDEAKSKINKVQQTANKITHPVSAAKDEIKEKIQKKVKAFLLEHWWLVGAVALVALILLIILLIFLGDEDGEGDILLDPYYDFTLTMVNVTNDYTNEEDKIDIERVTLREFLLGAAYYEFRDGLEGLSSSEELEVYKTFFIVAKSRLLAMGNYDNETKEITIKSGSSQMPYCSIFYGCKVVNKGGVYSYIPSNWEGSGEGDVVANIESASNSMISRLNDAYDDTKYWILVPKSFDSVLTSYTFDAPAYSSEIRERWIEDSSKYAIKINNTPEYADLKVYNIIDYALAYEYATDTAYWWPIGSLEPVHSNIFSGTPSATYVSSIFGPRTIQGHDSYHHGIDIASADCGKNVIIATRAGEVIQVEDGCPTMGSYGDTCNGGLGNYVRVSHLDGYVSLYAHMTLDSIVVEVGQHVNQGQKLGTMGSSGSSTGCHLHFGLAISGSYVDPLQYISADNPRPTYNINDPTNVDASSNKQSVCLSLKSTGFSDSAVAAIMTNIQAESGFNPQALGDSGTSYGLCQWHEGRYTALQSYCGSDYTKVNCQLRYLLHELQTSYKSVYQMLLTDNSAYELASYYCINFEVPYNRYVNCPLRAEKYATEMLGYVTNNCR